MVRDKIPQIIKESGIEPRISILDMDDYLASLFNKLDEEVQEVHEANSDQLLEEIADVFEVLRALSEASGFAWSQVESARMKKFLERGGFQERIWLHQH